jgi:hypothetical protein
MITVVEVDLVYSSFRPTKASSASAPSRDSRCSPLLRSIIKDSNRVNPKCVAIEL